jgi:superfamily II DNA/RNA helicase
MQISILKNDLDRESINISSKEMSDTSNEITEYTTWEQLELSDDLLRGIYAYGFEKPSPIQQKAIYPIKCGREIIAQAQSGTGKTATFTIGSLSRIKPEIVGTQILVLAPTHELANQTSAVFKGLGAHIPNLSAKTFVGGTSVRDDIAFVEKTPPTVAVGCPGRVLDLLRKRVFSIEHIQTIIIDEADEMLSQGFQEQVRSIFELLREDVQVLIFSATLNRDVMDITTKFMRDPVKIVMEAEKLSLAGIAQYYVSVRTDEDKYDVLRQIFAKMSINQCIIYCNSVNRVKQLYDAMIRDGFSVVCIHRDLGKLDRENAFNDFKTCKCRFLISSNITARGIDIQQVNLVVNFDLSRDPHTYLHRIGRSGRWGRKGTAINFLTHYDMRVKEDLENYYRMQIAPLPNDIQ